MSEETRSSKLLIAGASVPIVEGAAAMMHGGALGAIVALGVSGLVYIVADEMEERGKTIALPRLSLRKRSGGKNKRGFLYRAFTPKDMREEDLEDQISEGDEVDMNYLDLGPDFRPHVNSILSHCTVILGQPGSGKSNAIADLVEEVCQFDAPLIIFDSKPEYARLCAKPFMTNPHPVEPGSITPANARTFAYEVMQERWQVVIDLPSYRNNTTAAQVMNEIILAIMDWEAQYVPNVLPVTIVLDEAHRWFPQQQNLSTVAKSVYPQFLQTYINLVTGGRSLGMASIIATQRPQNIDKRVISVSHRYFLMQASYPNDLKVYRELAGADPETIQALAVGEVLVKDVETGEWNGLYRFRRRYSPDDAKTPGIKNLALSHPPGTPFSSSQERRESPALLATRPQPAAAPSNDLTQHPLTIETILALHQAGKLGEEALLRLIDLLPTVQTDEGEEEETVSGEENDTPPPTFPRSNGVGESTKGEEVRRPAHQPGEPVGDSPHHGRVSGEHQASRPGRNYPLMDENQIQQFIALYPINGVEKSLDLIKGCAHKHREHARAIIREYGLVRKRG